MDTTTCSVDILWASEKNGGGHAEAGSCDVKTLISEAYESGDYDVFETADDVEKMFDDNDERSLEAKKLLPCVGYRLYENDDYQLVPKAEMPELDWALEVFRREQEGKDRSLKVYNSPVEAYECCAAMKSLRDAKMMEYLCDFYPEAVAEASGIMRISYVDDLDDNEGQEGYEDDGETYYDFLSVPGDKHIASPAANPEKLIGEPATYEELKTLNLLWLLDDISVESVSMGKLIPNWHSVSKEN